MKRFFMLFAVIALLASVAFAQNGAFAPYVNGSVSTSAAMGFKNPNYTVGGGVESSTKYLLADIHGSIDTANLKSAYSTGAYTGAIAGSAYYKFFGHILAGGGANWQITNATFQNFNRQKFTETFNGGKTFIGGGFQFGKVRMIATTSLPGHFGDTLKGEHIVNVNTEYFLTKHIRITQETVLDSYIDGTNTRVTGDKLGAGVKFVL